MSFSGEGTHITTDMWFIVGRTHITRVMCFPSRGTHISIDMCSSTWKTHIASDMCFRDSGTHITRDSFFLYWVYITQCLTYSATYVFYLTSRKVSCFFFFFLQFQLNFSYFLYFHLTIIMCYISGRKMICTV